jgi:DNA-binding HxlR family transcriptional regulator
MNQTNCEPNCGVEKTLQLIGAKWTAMIIHNLLEGKNRFGLLERELVGISPKTLSIRLKELEASGLITKKVYAEIPLHVEYFLTNKGLSLQKVFQAMNEWGDSS